MADMRQWNSIRYGYSPLVLLLEDNVGRILVDSDTKAFELVLDDSLVSERLVNIKHYEDKMTGFGNGYNLTTSTFAVFGSLNDTRQIEHLDGRSVILHLTRDSGQGGKLISGGWTVISGRHVPYISLQG